MEKQHSIRIFSVTKQAFLETILGICNIDILKMSIFEMPKYFWEKQKKMGCVVGSLL